VSARVPHATWPPRQPRTIHFRGLIPDIPRQDVGPTRGKLRPEPLGMGGAKQAHWQIQYLLNRVLFGMTVLGMTVQEASFDPRGRKSDFFPCYALA